MADNRNVPTVPFNVPREPVVPERTPRAQQLALQQAMQRTSQLQGQGELQQSESMLRQILQSRPNFAPAIHLLGVVAHQSGQSELAIELIRKSIAINDQVPLFHTNLGEILRLQKDLDGAVEHGERATALDPSMTGALSNLGIAYYDREDYETAKIVHEKALALDANMPNSLNNMGSIMREFEQPEKALGYYHRAMAADASYLEPLNNLGLVLIEEDRHAEAIAPLTNAVNQNPHYSDAWCNLGCAYTVLDRFDKAIPAYQKTLELKGPTMLKLTWDWQGITWRSIS